MAEKYLEVITEFHLSMLLPPLLPAKRHNWFSALFSGGIQKVGQKKDPRMFATFDSPKTEVLRRALRLRDGGLLVGAKVHEEGRPSISAPEPIERHPR